MKTLFINRHAKSSWRDYSLKDFDRPLNSRGKRDSPVMADRFLKKEGKVDCIVSSPAKRAYQTALVFAKTLGLDEIHKEQEIYEARVSELMDVINSISDERTTALLFGHNPGLSSLVDYLSHENIYLPTCGIVRIDFKVDSWQEVSNGIGEFIYFDYPKNEIP